MWLCNMHPPSREYKPKGNSLSHSYPDSSTFTSPVVGFGVAIMEKFSIESVTAPLIAMGDLDDGIIVLLIRLPEASYTYCKIVASESLEACTLIPVATRNVAAETRMSLGGSILIGFSSLISQIYTYLSPIANNSLCYTT